MIHVKFAADVDPDDGGVDAAFIDARTDAPRRCGGISSPYAKGDLRMNMSSKIAAAGYIKRGPRIALRCPAVLVEEDGCVLEIVITDVSREGFRLESQSELEVGADVWLHVPKLDPVRGSIRWTCGFEAGGVFLEAAAL